VLKASKVNSAIDAVNESLPICESCSWGGLVTAFL